MKARLAKTIQRFFFGKSLKESLALKKKNRKFLREIKAHQGRVMMKHLHRFAVLYPRHKENLDKE